jgi:hypothetical protein
MVHFSSELVPQTDLDFFWDMMHAVHASPHNRFEAEVDDVCSMYMMGGEL